MSALTDARKAFSSLLDGVLAGVQVFSEFPERITPPFIAVGPGDPYVEFEGATFGHRRVRLIATYVADRGTNDLKAADIDDAVVALVETIDGDDAGAFVVTQVDQPGQISIGGQAHLGVSVHVLTEIGF